MNVVMTGAGRFVEVQGTAEGMAFTRGELDSLLGLAEAGIKELTRHAGGRPGRAASRGGESRGAARCGSWSRRPTRTRSRRSLRCSRPRSPSSWSRGHATCPRSSRTARRCSTTPRLKAQALVAATGLGRRGRRHRARGRRARGCARRLLGPLRRRGRHLRGQRDQAAAGARRSRRRVGSGPPGSRRSHSPPSPTGRRCGPKGSWRERSRRLRAEGTGSATTRSSSPSRGGRGRTDVRARWTRRRRMRCRTGVVPSVHWHSTWRRARRCSSPAAAASPRGHAKAAASS